jgi:hypothetical protein
LLARPDPQRQPNSLQRTRGLTRAPAEEAEMSQDTLSDVLRTVRLRAVFFT